MNNQNIDNESDKPIMNLKLRRLIVLIGIFVVLSSLTISLVQAFTKEYPYPDSSIQFGLQFKSVSAGGDHSCGLTIDHIVLCWGRTASGQSSPPDGTFTSVTAGAYHTCGLKTDGTVACWGDNTQGENTPPAGIFDTVTAGAYGTCGVRPDGTLACWGFPTNVVPSGTYVSISSGVNHICALKYDHTALCWGGDDYNQYGQATPPAEIFASIDAGYYHTCGVTGDRTVACWGWNNLGQSTVPASVGLVSAVSAGYEHTCALKLDGTITCWGSNLVGQSNAPDGLFLDVSASSYHTCATRTDGIVICWGSNEYGESTPYANELLVNGSFEIAGAGETSAYGWEYVNATGDARRCTTPDDKPSQAVDGRCFYNMVGTTGENSDLKQDIQWGSITPHSGDQLKLDGYIYPKGDQINTRVRVLVKYASQTSQKIVVRFFSASVSWQAIPTQSLTLTGTPSAVRVILNNLSEAGRVRYDGMSLKWLPASNEGVLPLPAAP